MKVKERWSHRAARMHPQHSKMEQWLLEELHKRGVHPFTDIGFLVHINGQEILTTPDFDFREYQLQVFIDGEKAHRKRQHRDAEIREALAEQYRFQVLSITYKGNSKKERQRTLKLILEALK